jgi:predicted transcriptional regulator of viral defense system
MKLYLDNYIESLLANGRYYVTRKELDSQFGVNEVAMRHGLRRLTRNKLILQVRSGFFVIIPPEHRNHGILPPEMFIDDFMRYLKRPYYAGLLSAAALHGAGHQQPQIFSVITDRPSIRHIQYKNLKICFPVKSEMPQAGIEQKKTPAGYIAVSSPELTALDLMTYLKQSGGLPAATAVLEELSELMTPEKLKPVASKPVPSTALQRLGFLLDTVFNREELADTLYTELQTRNFFHIPLNPAEAKGINPISKKWKISINADLEAEL